MTRVSKPIRVVIVEDSPTMRAILQARFEREDDIVVVGAAANAQEGRQMIRELDPDVVTLDVEMPGMNGLDFLEKIMALRPTPVIVVSGSTHEGAETTARALAIGAVGCYAKGEGRGGYSFDDQGKLADLVRDASKVRFVTRPAPQPATPPRTSLAPRSPTLIERPRLIAIGSSTGGVEALQVLLGGFPADCPPTLVVQHISARFAPAVARTLDQSCPPKIVIAEPDLPLRDGHVYIAPGDERHLTVGGRSGVLHQRLRHGEPVSGHLPSVDVLFHSAAEIVGGGAVGILLTGMGTDGAEGLGARKSRLKAHLYGGANVNRNMMRIGTANAEFAQAFLRREGIIVMREDMGGTNARRVDFRPASGQIRCRTVEDRLAPPVTPTARPDRASGDVELF